MANQSESPIQILSFQNNKQILLNKQINVPMKTTNNSGFIFKKSSALVLGLAFATLLSCEKDNLNDSASTSAAEVTTEVVSGNLTRKTYTCSSASAIQSALDSAVAGDIISISAGTYTGNFSSSKSGTSSSYITIQGVGATTILTCGSTASGNTALEISGSYWKIKNMSITKASIGVKLDNSDYSTVESVIVSNTGQEGIHFLNGTSYATVKSCTVTDTGNVTTKYGEGIYIGSDYGKWLENGGSYDKACNYNTIDSCIIQGKRL